MVICLERDADLHMAQLMLLPLTVSCFSKIQIGFTFLVPAHPGSPGQTAVKRACVCVCVSMFVKVVRLKLIRQVSPRVCVSILTTRLVGCRRRSDGDSAGGAARGRRQRERRRATTVRRTDRLARAAEPRRTVAPSRPARRPVHGLPPLCGPRRSLAAHPRSPGARYGRV